MSARLQWLKCPLCDEMFESYFTLNIHMDEKHEETKLVSGEEEAENDSDSDNTNSGDESDFDSDRESDLEDNTSDDDDGFSFNEVRAILRYFRHEQN